VVSIDETADHTIRELFHYKIPASFMGSHAWCSDQVHTITGQASLWRSSLQTSQNRLSGTSRNRRTTHTMIQPDSTSSRPCHPCKLRRGLLLKAGTATSRCSRLPGHQQSPVVLWTFFYLLMSFYEVYGIFGQYYLITQIIG
jgi:hypothetical protein